MRVLLEVFWGPEVKNPFENDVLQAHFDLRDPENVGQNKDFPPIIACRHQPSCRMRLQLGKLKRGGPRSAGHRRNPEQPRTTPNTAEPP